MTQLKTNCWRMLGVKETSQALEFGSKYLLRQFSPHHYQPLFRLCGQSSPPRNMYLKCLYLLMLKPVMVGLVKYLPAFAPRGKCPNTEFSLAHVFLYSDWIRRFTAYISVFSTHTGKYGPEKTPYLDTFLAVLLFLYLVCFYLACGVVVDAKS